MIDLQNNDATHGDETYQDYFTTQTFEQARRQVFDSLNNGDEDIKAIAIDELIQDEKFWNAVFSIGTDDNIAGPSNVRIVDFAAIKTSVFCSVSGEIGKLAKELT